MKKVIYFLLSLAIVMTGITSCYDDGPLKEEIDSLKSKVASLEELTSQMNTNISALQTAVAALQNNDYVTSITEIKEGETVIGYTVKYSKSGNSTIYLRKDGFAPAIGVKQFDDGLYYWTVNDQWLINDEGIKIKAEGLESIAPKLKIDNGLWMLSVDKGLTWTNLGKATGEEGESFFNSITQDEENVYLNIANGTKIVLPKNKPLNITFDESADISITAGATKTLNYTITGATSTTIVKAMGQNGWSAKVTPTNNESGKITVIASNPLVEDEILVWVYDGETKTIMSSLNFVTGVITVASNAYYLPKDANRHTVTVNTNIDYIVDIPKEALSWISVESTRSAMRTETLTFNISENVGFTRFATIYLKNNTGNVLQTIAFEQVGDVISVNVATPGTLSTFFSSDQKTNIKYLKISGTLNEYDFLTIKEMTSLSNLDISMINNTTLPGRLFENNKIINEVILPYNLMSIPDYLFYSSNINSCLIPSKVTSIGNYAFSYSNLSGVLEIPFSVKFIGNFAYDNCIRLTNLQLNEGIENIGISAFYLCEGFTGQLILPRSITSIGNSAFNGCHGFTGTLNLPENLTSLYASTFGFCSGFSGDLVIPSKITVIDGGAFWGCTGINKIYSKNPTPPTLFNILSHSGTIFPNHNYLGVPIGSKVAYQNATSRYPVNDKWSNFLVIEEVDFAALGL